MIHFDTLELLNSIHRCPPHSLGQFHAQLLLFASIDYETLCEIQNRMLHIFGHKIEFNGPLWCFGIAQLSPKMCCSHFCAVLRTSSCIRILSLWNVVWYLKSNVTLLGTQNRVQWSTLMLWNVLNSLHRCASHSFVQFCAQLFLFASLAYETLCEILNWMLYLLGH